MVEVGPGEGTLREVEEEYTDEEMLEILKRADENWRWIEEERQRLAREYPNQYICVQDRRVVAAGEDIREALKGIKPTPDMVCEYILPHGVAMIL